MSVKTLDEKIAFQRQLRLAARVAVQSHPRMIKDLRAEAAKLLEKAAVMERQCENAPELLARAEAELARLEQQVVMRELKTGERKSPAPSKLEKAKARRAKLQEQLAKLNAEIGVSHG